MVEDQTNQLNFESLSFPDMTYPSGIDADPYSTLLRSTDSLSSYQNDLAELFRSCGSSAPAEQGPTIPNQVLEEKPRSRSSSLETVQGVEQDVREPAFEFGICPHEAASLANAGRVAETLNKDTTYHEEPELVHSPPSNPTDSTGLRPPSPFELTQEQVEEKAKKRKRKVYEPEVKIYAEPTDQDVLCQRGGKSNSHPGNKRFLAAKEDFQLEYFATPKVERTRVSQKLVDHVHAWGGRFLKKDEERKDADYWFVVHNHVARTKAGQALRETYTPEERAAKRAKYNKKKGAKRKN